MSGKSGLWWLLAVLSVLLLCVFGILVNFQAPEKEADETGGEKQPEGFVFDMQEVPVFEYEGPLKDRLLYGQTAEECGDKPNERVKAYPQLKSEKPVYGTVTFDMSFVQPSLGLRYCFVVDESQGTQTGYDSLYFDANHDFDLTNDPALSPMKELPPGAERSALANEGVWFEYLQLSLDYGSDVGTWPVKIIPRFISHEGGYKRMTFLVPTARTGKISIGSKEFEAVLAQSIAVTGRFDRPTTGLFLANDPEPFWFLSLMRYEDDTLYTLSATPAGDKLMVTPYRGPFGILDVGPGGRDVKNVTLELGWLQSEEGFINIDRCPKEGKKVKLPVGDYRPFRLGVCLGDVRVGVAANISLPGACGAAQEKPPVFGIKIRQDKPFVFDFSNEVKVDFRNPAAGQRVKLGEELKVEAIVYDPVMDILIAGLEDTTRKVGEPRELWAGRKWQEYERLDPVVKISNSSGECVSEGKMPFG